MARRPPTGPAFTIGGANNQQRNRRSQSIGIMRLLSCVGFVIVMLGMHLYSRALRAVSSGNIIYNSYSGGVVETSSSSSHREEKMRRDNKVHANAKGADSDKEAMTYNNDNMELDDASNQISKNNLLGDQSHNHLESIDGVISATDDDANANSNLAVLEGGSSSSSSSNPYKTPWHGAPPPTPPYWLESDPDDSFERIYLTNTERKKYKHLRNLGANGDVNGVKGIKHYFNPMCRHYRFDESILPTVSVIMTTQNEPDNWVSISVESILARTPPHLLREVIVVDDNGMPGHHGLPENIRKNVDESEWEYIQSLSPKVKVIHHDDREGCARSRLTGAKAATGEVLMFVDSHIEMESSTWYHHLVAPIMENPHTIAMQLIDIIDDLGTKGYGDGVGMGQYGIVNTEFWFGYQGDRFGDYMEPIDPTNFTQSELDERKKMKYLAEKPTAREPYETPFGPGSLFAIRADEFWRLGGYDEGLYVWGGENTEMAFKMWMCGGRMLMVPCSRVGHMYRQHKESDGRGALTRWPPTLPQEMTDRLGCAYKNGTYTGKFIVLRHPADNFTRITTRNNLRVMETWVGDHPAKYAYYKRLFGQTTLKPEFQLFIDQWRVDPVAQKQVQIKKENQCHDFEWFDKHVFMRLTGRHHPWHPDNKKYLQVSCGNHKAKSCDLCPQGHGKDWCHGDCTWCTSSEQCFPADDWSKMCEVKKGGLRSSSIKKEVVPEESVVSDAEAFEMKESDQIDVANEVAVLHLEKRERARLSEDMVQSDNHLTLSVVLPCGFEHEFFIRTAESIFYQTPKEILKEIVIVDDASDPPLQDSWPAEEAEKFGVKYVRVDSALGLIGAKQAGAEAATGDIIVFFDCHVKPAENYWVPYVKAVQENYKRVVIPTITSLNVDKWEEFGRPAPGGGGMSKCYLTFDAEFKWTTDNTTFVPIMSGGLLAISRKWFFEIGGYDSTMKGWGGENLDQSLRIWTCGGEIVSAPESYVAHMWRAGNDPKTKAKYKVGAGDAIKNRARAVKAHLGRWYEKTLTFPSFQDWRGKELDTSSINDSFSNLKCENFEWYLNRFKHIYRDAGVLPSEVFQIEVVSSIQDEESPPLCLELNSMRWTNFGSADDIVLRECVGSSANEPRSIWWHGSSRLSDGKCCGSLRAWNTDQCIDGRHPEIGSSKLETYTCDLDSGLEAFLQPSKDNNDELTLRLGRNNNHVCVRVNEDALFEFVQCDKATKFRKRHAFTPIEYELLSSDSKSVWQEVQ